MERILADSNIFLEFFCSRRGVVEEVERFLDLVEAQSLQLYVTNWGLWKLKFFLSRQDRLQADRIVARLREMLDDRIIPVSCDRIQQAQKLSLPDIEAAIEVACAESQGIDAILTLQPESFEGARLIVLSLQEFMMRRQLRYPIIAKNLDESLCNIQRWAAARESRVVCAGNVQFLIETYHNPNFPALLRQVDLIDPAGMPVVWLLKVMRTRDQQRIAEMDLFKGLCQRNRQGALSLFFLTDDERMLRPLTDKLKRDFPGLRISGCRALNASGNTTRVTHQECDQAIVREINDSKAGLVFISMESPKQEYWSFAHKGQIKAVMVGLGSALSVYTGVYKPAPRWLQHSGGEGLHRWFQDPKRFRTYGKSVKLFLWLTLTNCSAIKQQLSSWNQCCGSP